MLPMNFPKILEDDRPSDKEKLTKFCSNI